MKLLIMSLFSLMLQGCSSFSQSNLSIASTHPHFLGFELTTTTLSDFLEKNKNNSTLFRIPATDSYIANGYMLTPKNSKSTGVERAVFTFDQSDRLCMIIADLPHSKFKGMVALAEEQYELIGQEMGITGGDNVAFRFNTDLIFFESNPKRKFMHVMFMNESYKEDSDERTRSYGYRPMFQ